MFTSTGLPSEQFWLIWKELDGGNYTSSATVRSKTFLPEIVFDILLEKNRIKQIRDSSNSKLISAVSKKCGGEINSEKIKKLAIDFRISPSAVCKIAFSGKYSSGVIRAAILHIREDEMIEKDYLAIRDGTKYDHCSSFAEKIRGIIAADAENTFVSALRAAGYIFQTQEDLILAGSKLTPDILFARAENICGKKIRWIDFKNYFGMPIGILHRSCIKQGKKYSAVWGTGAFFYSRGFVHGLCFDDAICLTAPGH